MTNTNSFSNYNPMKIILNQNTIDDLMVNYNVISASKNHHIEGYNDYYIDTTSTDEPDLTYTIVTTGENKKIESIIYRFRSSKFKALYDSLKNNLHNVNVSETPVKSGKHIIFDRGDHFIFLWQKQDEDEFDLQHCTKIFISKIRPSW